MTCLHGKMCINHSGRIYFVSTNREQVQQVCVGVHVGRSDLDQCQLLQDGVQLLGLGEVDPCLLLVGPVGQRHVHGDEVFQVHAQDGEAEARALGEALAVLAVVAARRHQLDEAVENLQEGRTEEGGTELIWVTGTMEGEERVGRDGGGQTEH